MWPALAIRWLRPVFRDQSERYFFLQATSGILLEHPTHTHRLSCRRIREHFPRAKARQQHRHLTLQVVWEEYRQAHKPSAVLVLAPNVASWSSWPTGAGKA